MLYGYKILVYCTSHVYERRFSDFIQGLNDTLVENGWRVFVFCTESDLYKKNKNNDGFSKIFELINYDIADAVLISQEDLLNQLVKKRIIRKAQAKNIPVLSLGNNPEVNSIEFDRENGFEKVVRHVVEHHKIRNLHFIAGLETSVESKERLEVFKKVIKENHIAFSDEMVSYGDFWDMPTKIAVQKLIDLDKVPDAFICANDSMALAAISVLSQNGYKCPEDVLVTGFDGIQEIFYSNPKVTSALCDFSKLGKETAEFLFRVVEENLDKAHAFVPSSLIIAESCGCESKVDLGSVQNFISYTNDSYNRYRTEDMQLSNISALVHDCKTPEAITKVLLNPLLYNMFILLKSECLNPSLDPNISHSPSVYGDSMYVLLDSDMGLAGCNKYIKTSELIPRMQNILENYRMPLVFTSLNSIDLPMGYLCFCFCNYDRQNYIKIGQIATWVGNAFSGYRSMQYQWALQKQIMNMYRHDSLTGLLNRTGFQEEYNKLLKDTSVSEISLAMCDLDNLKHINDNFSHNAGDEAIRTVGEALSRALDLKKKCYYCRYGGDEILALYPFAIDTSELMVKVTEYLNNYNSNSENLFEVSTSLGVYTGPKVPFEEAFGKADKLMYVQKQSKKNRRK